MTRLADRVGDSSRPRQQLTSRRIEQHLYRLGRSIAAGLCRFGKSLFGVDSAMTVVEQRAPGRRTRWHDSGERRARRRGTQSRQMRWSSPGFARSPGTGSITGSCSTQKGPVRAVPLVTAVTFERRSSCRPTGWTFAEEHRCLDESWSRRLRRRTREFPDRRGRRKIRRTTHGSRDSACRTPVAREPGVVPASIESAEHGRVRRLRAAARMSRPAPPMRGSGAARKPAPGS